MPITGYGIAKQGSLQRYGATPTQSLRRPRRNCARIRYQGAPPRHARDRGQPPRARIRAQRPSPGQGDWRI